MIMTRTAVSAARTSGAAHLRGAGQTLARRRPRRTPTEKPFILGLTGTQIFGLGMMMIAALVGLLTR